MTILEDHSRGALVDLHVGEQRFIRLPGAKFPDRPPELVRFVFDLPPLVGGELVGGWAFFGAAFCGGAAAGGFCVNATAAREAANARANNVLDIGSPGEGTLSPGLLYSTVEPDYED